MSIIIEHKTVDIVVNTKGMEVQGNVIPEAEKPQKEAKVLRLHYSLMGEKKPVLSPLSIEYSFDDKKSAYRYDWIVGITSCAWGWDWQKDMREQRAMAVQLLIDCGNSGFGFSEVSAMLLALQPSRDNSSWLDKHADKIGENLGKLSEITQPINNTAANIIKISSVMSNFIGSGEKNAKNWFIYRFLDEEKKCCVVEWNLHKKVLEQYGPLLRGSIILTFHGTGKTGDSIRMLLRPRLGFGKRSELDYLPPDKDLEKENPVELSIEPIKPSAAKAKH